MISHGVMLMCQYTMLTIGNFLCSCFHRLVFFTRDFQFGDETNARLDYSRDTPHLECKVFVVSSEER